MSADATVRVLQYGANHATMRVQDDTTLTDLTCRLCVACLVSTDTIELLQNGKLIDMIDSANSATM